MHLIPLLVLFVAFVCILATTMACTTPFDVLRAKVEDLGPMLLVRASWKDPWLNLIPREEYPRGAGYVRSQFTIGRSEPATDEETWAAIAAIDANANPNGACNLTYNQTFVGQKEDQYKPENFGLMGPLICQDDLTMYWNSAAFWERYFQALEKRNRKSIINRLGNIYRQYVPKASCNASFAFTAGDYATQPAPSAVNMTVLQGANIPTSELTQEFLDSTAIELSEEGADEPNSNGWITQGADGPIFPLYIGQYASHRILLNNSELRSDFNNSFQGYADANPVIKRLGASRIVKNFRHVINRFPARWTTQQVDASGAQGSGVGFVYGTDDGILKRVPTWQMSTTSINATKGQVAIVNPSWRDPNLAKFESCEVLNPWVFTEEVLMPVNSLPGAKLNPQNYFGEWAFVTGNDALLGISSCAGVQDPMKKYGRHFAEYRHAAKPQFPLYGRLILFRRCANAFDTLTCS